jgi:hypothetical protein
VTLCGRLVLAPVGQDLRPWPHHRSPGRRPAAAAVGARPPAVATDRGGAGPFRGQFAYVAAELPDEQVLPFMRRRYGGSASQWGFAVYLASKNGYEDSVLANGFTAGAPEDALDTACGLYFADPTAWN